METNEKEMILGFLHDVTTRLQLARGADRRQYEGYRDLWEVLGYPSSLTFEDMWSLYRRGDLAQRIVNAYPNATWRANPTVKQRRRSRSRTPAFDQAWEDHVDQVPVFHYFERVDKLAGIMDYALLLIGFNDGKPFEAPVGRAKQVLYLTPFRRDHAEIHSYNSNTNDPNYGLPEFYRLTLSTDWKPNQGPNQVLVHHSRIIHVADQLLEDDIFGMSRLEAVYNRFMDLAKVVGGSGEMFWRGGYPGIGLMADANATFTEKDKEEIDKQLFAYVHKLQRFLKIQGAEIQQLTPQVANPKEHFAMLLSIIAGTTGIPQRILIGSERGELASSQDETAWNDRIEERRTGYAARILIRPYVDRMIMTGALPEPQDGYTIEWPERDSLNDQDRAEVASKKAKAIADYVNAPGAELIMPVDLFRRLVLGMTQEQIDEANELVDRDMDEDMDLDLEPEDEEDSDDLGGEQAIST